MPPVLCIMRVEEHPMAVLMSMTMLSKQVYLFQGLLAFISFRGSMIISDSECNSKQAISTIYALDQWVSNQ